MNKDAQRLQRIEKFRQAWREETLTVSAFSSLYTSLQAMLKTYERTNQQ